MSNDDFIPEIQLAVERAAGCPAEHLRTALVIEGWKNDIVWQGEVEVFTLKGHPKANQAYGWRDIESGEFTAVLEIPPVDSPNTAVRAAIVAKARK